MPVSLMRAAFHAFLCALMLAVPGPLGPSFAQARVSVSVPAVPLSQEKEESCGRGKATTDFGWRVVSFGVDTLKYLIGLFIIPIGLFLVVIGYLLQMLEAVVC
jgi:hypothetical protein